MTNHRVGYVGVDHHHRDPYFAIAAALPVDIVAVCEPGREVDPASLRPMTDRPDEITAGDDDTLEVATDAESYAEPDDLLAEEDLDIVWITYSNVETPSIVEAAVDAGVHVISEKPIARTADDLRPITDLAEKRGVSIVPTYFYRANPIVERLCEHVASGFFGDIWSIQGRFIGSQLSYRDTNHYIYDAEASRGGALQWIGVHWLDIMSHVLDDEIDRVIATMSPAESADVECGATVHFETETGVLGTLQTGYYLDGTGKDTDFAIYGRDGQAWSPIHHDATMKSPTAPLTLQSGRPSWDAAPVRSTEYEFSYDTFPAWGDYVFRYFERCLAGLAEGDPLADIHDAIRILEILDAAYASAAEGTWITVGNA